MTLPIAPRISLVMRKPDPKNDLPNSVVNGLRRNGLDAHAYNDGDPAVLHGDVVLLLGQPSGCRRTIRQIERTHPQHRPRVGAWLFEPLPPPQMTLPLMRIATSLSALRTGRTWARPFMRVLSFPLDFGLALHLRAGVGAHSLRFLIDSGAFVLRGRDFGWLDAIFVSTEQKRLQLAAWAIPSQFLPIGQQPIFGQDHGRPRDIDVLFVGSVKNRRRKTALAQLTGQLRALGLTVHQPTSPLWGPARTDMVNRAKIVLHMHQYVWDTPWMRWYLATANGAVVASEPLSVPHPLRPGIDYLEATPQFARDIAYLAQNETARAAMLAACRTTIETHLLQTHSIDDLSHALRALCAPSGGVP